jgi:putative DNA primase/helicase
VKFTAPGFVVHSFAGDDPKEARDYVRERLGLSPPQKRWRRNTKPMDEDDRYSRIENARKIWSAGVDPHGTIVEKYLKSRALVLPDAVASLRYHAHCPWRNEETQRTDYIPVLLAAFRSITTDEITAVHRIRLDQPERWPKAERRMLGIVFGSAVKLGDKPTDTLAIGEGVETCLAACQLGYKPAWALGSVGAISFFPIIESVRTLIILGETGTASADAVQLCGRRWTRTGRRVRIARSSVGSDLNDELMQRA